MNDLALDPWRTTSPSDPMAVAEALTRIGRPPTGELRLLAAKHITAYSAWLWTDETGAAFFSKAPLRGAPFVWKAKGEAEALLRRNRGLRPIQEVSP